MFTIHTSSGACLIDEGDTFLLTGGLHGKSGVTRYDINGWIEDLERLNDERWYHGCTQYTANDGQKVR